MDYTQRFAQAVVNVRYEEFSNELINASRGIVLDGVANMLAGSREPLATPLVGYLRESGCGPCTVIGSDLKVQPHDAAFANATFCHSMDYEIHSWPLPNHPTSPVLASILALSQVRMVTGKQAIEAIVAGFEVSTRLVQSIVVSRDELLDGQLHPPGVVGPFGAAAAVAKLLGLSASELQMAFGIVGSRVCGLLANTGTMTKASHLGNAARNGLESALLAAHGFTANPDILETVNGLNEVYFDKELDLSILIDNFGSPYSILDPGFNVKKYPSQFPTHWPVDATLELLAEEDFDARDVVDVVVETGTDDPTALVADPPITGLAGKFSTRYTVAAALLDGRVVIDTFRDERLAASDMQEMMGRIRYILRPDIVTRGATERWSRVTITTKDGREFSRRVDWPLGTHRRPISWERWVAKYRDCARHALSEERVDTILEQIESFDELDDVGRFVESLCA